MKRTCSRKKAVNSLFFSFFCRFPCKRLTERDHIFLLASQASGPTRQQRYGVCSPLSLRAPTQCWGGLALQKSGVEKFCKRESEPITVFLFLRFWRGVVSFCVIFFFVCASAGGGGHYCFQTWLITVEMFPKGRHWHNWHLFFPVPSFCISVRLVIQPGSSERLTPTPPLRAVPRRLIHHQMRDEKKPGTTTEKKLLTNRRANFNFELDRHTNLGGGGTIPHL